METCPHSPEPPGSPRWVAMFYQPATASWKVGAEAPHRSSVLYALGQMQQTIRARGEDPTVDLWGPDHGVWKRFDTPAAAAPVAAPQPPSGKQRETGKLGERMSDRRHQTLMAGLSKACLYDLAPEDSAAIQALVDQLDEDTVRRVAYWLAVASGGQ
ncbi:hypothetical protein ABZW18_27110 [Streptomyces sp. NPDC004647]|uniref:hypothetical protein n=1 Tax=Streptomyces sp. NPDC004647 TaxID=3154671 RepID=UPI00339DDE7A